MECFWIILLQDIKEKILFYHDYSYVEEGYNREFYYKLPKLYHKIEEVLNCDDLNKYDDDVAYNLCNQARVLFKELNGKGICKLVPTTLNYDDILEELKYIDNGYLID